MSNYSRWTIGRTCVTAIGFCIIFLIWLNAYREKHPAYAVEDSTTLNIRRSYNGFNAAFFGDELPQDVQFGYTTNDKARAITYRTKEGKFIIDFNMKYNAAESTRDMNLLHEMCHIKTWDVEKKFQDHEGPWESCMEDIAKHGGFRGLW